MCGLDKLGRAEFDKVLIQSWWPLFEHTAVLELLLCLNTK